MFGATKGVERRQSELGTMGELVGGLMGVGPDRRNGFANIYFEANGTLRLEPLKVDARAFANAPPAVRARESVLRTPWRGGWWTVTSSQAVMMGLWGETYRLLKRRRALVGTRCSDGLEMFGRYEGSLCGNTTGWLPATATDLPSSAAARSALGNGGKWTWAGTPGFIFQDGGMLQTPWGKGEWGLVPGLSRDSAMYVRFVDLDHVLRLSGGRWESQRCADGDKSVVAPG
ncbi:hypothetical protein T492DRAFT_954976 [Pavlovales sp. CCMP2436]|nr:hypothetical protein T492DRAFT_954976 [Pavlovales sp. CCMP2436]